MCCCLGTLCECDECDDCDACMLFVLCVCMLRECDGARVTAMMVWGKGRFGCGECMA